MALTPADKISIEIINMCIDDAARKLAAGRTDGERDRWQETLSTLNARLATLRRKLAEEMEA